ncbi:MAG: tetratricopeptide repeat protein [Burkholderiales bacterium]
MDFDKALELEPNNALALRGRGKAKRQLKQYMKATKDYDKVLVIEPQKIEAIAISSQSNSILNSDQSMLDKVCFTQSETKRKCEISTLATKKQKTEHHALQPKPKIALDNIALDKVPV